MSEAWLPAGSDSKDQRKAKLCAPPQAPSLSASVAEAVSSTGSLSAGAVVEAEAVATGALPPQLETLTVATAGRLRWPAASVATRRSA